MTNLELFDAVNAELRKRGYDDFRLTYLEGQTKLTGIGIEILVGGSKFRTAWLVKDQSMTLKMIADRVAEWMDSVRAAPEKYRAA